MVELPPGAPVIFHMNRTLRYSFLVVAVLALLLIILHLLLPWLVREYLNDRLADMGDYRGHIEDVDLTRINDFASAYGKFDFRAGEGDLTLELTVRERQLDGYIKPLLRHVDVFDLDQDIRNEDKGFFRGLWEAIVHGGQEVLQNQRKDQFATRIELSGSLDNTEASAFRAVLAILRNAFVEAFTPRFERALDEEE